VQPEGSPYPPILDMKTISGPFEIDGPGGPIPFRPFRVGHGSIDSLGFRMGGLAYLPDVAEIYDDAWEELHDLDCWVVDALRRTPHPTHAHLERSLEWIAKVQPKQAILTNMHIDMDYQTVSAETPDNVSVAYDGLTLRLPL